MANSKLFSKQSTVATPTQITSSNFGVTPFKKEIDAFDKLYELFPSEEEKAKIQKQLDAEKRAKHWNDLNVEKINQIIQSLAIFGYTGKSLKFGVDTNNNDKNTFYFTYYQIAVIYDKGQTEPDFWAFHIHIDNKTWQIIQAIKKLYTIKEYSTITETIESSRKTYDNHYLVRIKR